MPVAIGFGEPDTFLIHATGEVTYAEAQRAMDDVLGHPSYARSRKVLVDGRGVTGAPSTAELRAIARDLKPLIDRGFGPMAIVTEKGFVYGVARMFAVFAEVFGLSVRAFGTMDEAADWLRSQPAAPGREG
jgi:hypothetical protein